MIEKDTVRLLRECDAGIKMGLKAIDEVMNYAEKSIFFRTSGNNGNAISPFGCWFIFCLYFFSLWQKLKFIFINLN